MLRSLRWALAWALFILGLCLIPGSALPEWTWVSLLDLDKLVHLGMFLVLAVLLAAAFKEQGWPSAFISSAVGIAILYGVGTEVLQGMEALGRRTDAGDMIANAVGAIMGAVYVRARTRYGKPVLPIRLP